MFRRPTICVVVATFERPDMLAQCLSSIVGQTTPPDEVIVVDDSGRRSAEAIVRAFETRLPIIYLPQSHAGVGAARNAGIAATTCDWVCIQDDDDLMLPSRIESHVRQVSSSHVDISYGGWINFDVETGSAAALPGKAFDIDTFFYSGLVLTHGAAAIRRSLLVDHPYLESRKAGVDFDLFARLATAGATFSHCGDFLILRRIHASRIGTQAAAAQDTVRRVWVEHWDAFKGAENGEGRRQQARSATFSATRLSDDVVDALGAASVAPRRLDIPVNRRWARSSGLIEELLDIGVPFVIDGPVEGAHLTLRTNLSQLAPEKARAIYAVAHSKTALVELSDEEHEHQSVYIESPAPSRPGMVLVMVFDDVESAFDVLRGLDQSRWLWSLSTRQKIERYLPGPANVDGDVVDVMSRIDAGGGRCWLALDGASSRKQLDRVA